MKDEKAREAQSEIGDAIDAVFYAAGLLRDSGNWAGAQRLGDIGDRLHDEWLLLSKRKLVS